jgi:hypothetical protein
MVFERKELHMKDSTKEQVSHTSMRVIFLDIDGVLISHRSTISFGHRPNDLTPADVAKFDPVALALLRNLCTVANIQIILSSSWRILHAWQDVGKALDLPLIDATPRLLGERGREIAHWLSNHPEVERYAIIDDDSDMLPEQKPFFVHCNGSNGFTWPEFEKLCAIFSINPHECFQGRLRELSNPALEWV